MRGGDQLNQVLVAGVVLAEQGQMMGAALAGVLIPVAVVGDVDFAAQDRFDALFPAFGIEINDAVHRAVVGDG